MTHEQALEMVLSAARDRARQMEVERRRGWLEHADMLWEAIEQVSKQIDPRLQARGLAIHSNKESRQ